MNIEISGYIYRQLDSLLIVMPKNGDNHLHIYTPSECIFHDGETRFYSYQDHIAKRERKEIISISYDPDKTFGLDCDGTATYIEYGTESNNGITGAVNYWDRYNDLDKIEKAISDAQWFGLANGLAAVCKNMYDP